jgi:hypothetical protein
MGEKDWAGPSRPKWIKKSRRIDLMMCFLGAEIARVPFKVGLVKKERKKTPHSAGRRKEL